MISPPTAYLNNLINTTGRGKGVTAVIQGLLSCKKPLHFILSQDEMQLNEIVLHQAEFLKGSLGELPAFFIGCKVIHLKKMERIYTVRSLRPKIQLRSVDGSEAQPNNLDAYIPLSRSKHSQPGAVRSHIKAFSENYYAAEPRHYYNLHRLLVIGNQNIFKSLPTSLPACFVCKEDDGALKIDYNSAVLPKVVVMKDINLLEQYLEEEDFGDHISFGNCLVIGDGCAKQSLNAIRNHFHKGAFEHIVFFTEKDDKIELGNNTPVLRWKWTIPEINFLKASNKTEPEIIIVHNENFEHSIRDFYVEVGKIETQFGVDLRTVYQQIRRLYFNWLPDTESNKYRLQKIKEDFKDAIVESLSDILLDANPEADCQTYAYRLIEKFTSIADALHVNSKTTKLAELSNIPDRIISPSFIAARHAEYIKKVASVNMQKQPIIKANSLQALAGLALSRPLTEALVASEHSRKNWVNTISSSLSRCKPQAGDYCLITSMYGLGGVEKLIDFLCKAEGNYSLLLYSTEADMWRYHLEHYKERLAEEYASKDRFEISGTAFNDAYFHCSTFDHFIETLATASIHNSIGEEYWLSFTVGKDIKIPASRRVLRIVPSGKKPVLVDELEIGDKVCIYTNPDRHIIGRIVSLENPEITERAKQYAQLWQRCFLDYYQKDVFTVTKESLYASLKANRFSASPERMVYYLQTSGDIFFPRSNADLVAIAKTINDDRLNLTILKTELFPTKREYIGKLLEAGKCLSDAINEFIVSGFKNNFLVEKLSEEEVAHIIAMLPERIIKEIELAGSKNENHE